MSALCPAPARAATALAVGKAAFGLVSQPQYKKAQGTEAGDRALQRFMTRS